MTSSISALHTPDAAIDIADSVRRPPSVAANSQTDSMIAPPLTVHQMTTEESKLPMVTSSSTASVAARSLADVSTPANQMIGPRTPTSDGERLTSVPTMFAPPSSDSTIQAWSYGVLSSPSTLKTPQQSQPPAPGAPPGANSKPTPAATSSSQPAASNPSSPPHSGTLASPASRSSFRADYPRPPSTPPPTRMTEPKPPKKLAQVTRAPLLAKAAGEPWQFA